MRRRTWWVAVLLFLLMAATGAMIVRGRRVPMADQVAQVAATPPRRPDSRSLQRNRRTPFATPGAVSASPTATPRDGVAVVPMPIMGSGNSDSTANGPRHPHPITPAHKRIFRENEMLGALNGAVDARDFQALRRLNEQYRAEFPEDDHLLQEGYDLIAACLEARTAHTQARAERFMDAQRMIASTARRYVRRHCLE